MIWAESVGMGGFEPPASRTLSECANQAALHPETNTEQGYKSLRVAHGVVYYEYAFPCLSYDANFINLPAGALVGIVRG